MPDEIQKETTTEEKAEPKLSVLEETKAAISELKREREEFSKIKDELNQLRSEQLLSGTAGARSEIKPDTRTQQEKAKAYADSIMKGKVPSVDAQE